MSQKIESKELEIPVSGPCDGRCRICLRECCGACIGGPLYSEVERENGQEIQIGVRLACRLKASLQYGKINEDYVLKSKTQINLHCPLFQKAVWE